MPRRAARRRVKQRRSRRGGTGDGVMPVYPILPAPGYVAGMLGRWLARPSRFGLSPVLVGFIGLTLLIWIVVGLSLAGN